MGESVAASGVGGVRLTSGVDELTTAGPVGDSRGGGCAAGDGTTFGEEYKISYNR